MRVANSKGRLVSPQAGAPLVCGFLLGFLMFTQTLMAASGPQVGKLFVGEKIGYNIRYLGLTIGKAYSEVKEITTWKGRKVYHVIVTVRSTSVVDLIFRVRGEHHTYIDVQNGTSLKYESRSSEDPKAPSDLIMTFDSSTKKVEYVYPRRNLRKTFDTFAESQDRLSLGYFFRMLALAPQSEVTIPVHTRQKNWRIHVQTLKTSSRKIKGLGNIQVLEAVSGLGFVSRLSQPGSVRGWLSLDERRIPVEVSAKSPFIGSVHVVMETYQAGK